MTFRKSNDDFILVDIYLPAHVYISLYSRPLKKRTHRRVRNINRSHACKEQSFAKLKMALIND